jgi:hypothetical protein
MLVQAIAWVLQLEQFLIFDLCKYEYAILEIEYCLTCLPAGRVSINFLVKGVVVGICLQIPEPFI